MYWSAACWSREDCTDSSPPPLSEVAQLKAPQTEYRPAVGLGAVRPQQSQAVAGRDIRRVLEGGQIAPDPGGQNERRRHHSDAEQKESPSQRDPTGDQGGGDQQAGHEQDQLGPHQSFDPAGKAEQDSRTHGRRCE